jgi:hypothetical protein
MKSIKQQYINLREGNMTQAQFMRNLRMTMPYLVTNVTSFNDSIKILKNKGILTEADMNMASVDPNELRMGIQVEMEHTDDRREAAKIAMDHLKENPKYYSDLKKSGVDKPQGLKPTSTSNISSGELSATNDTYHRDGFNIGYFEEALSEVKDEKAKWTNANGKAMYDTFKEIDNLNAQEVIIGLDWEMEKNPKLTKAEAAKIVIKNLGKNPLYYTMTDLAGKEGAEAEYMGPKADIAARQMQPLDKNMSNIVDKKRGMQPVKGIEKAKKDSDKGGETNKPTKGITLMSLVAKTTRGLKKMDPTGEKMKTIKKK